MADNQIVKKAKCYVCGADVNFKLSKKNTVYYACNGETSHLSCGTRLFFGEQPSRVMLSQQQSKEENHVDVQSGRPAQPAEEKTPEPVRAEPEGNPAGTDQLAEHRSNPYEFWNV
jgi:hypothetical protein